MKLKKVTIGIIGATGFIGKNVCEKLNEEGFKLNCLIRKSSKQQDIEFLKRLNVKIIYGDIETKNSLREIILNSDILINCAGILGNSGKSNIEYRQVNFKGVENIVDVINGGKKSIKLIHISSAGVLGPIINGNETNKPNPTNIYERTKLKGEQAIISNCKNYVILRPEFLYGKHDFHVLELFRAIKKRQFFMLGNGKSMLHPTYIDDLINCIIKSIDNNIKNEIFIIAGDRPITVIEFYKIVAKELNVKMNKINIPIYIARLGVIILEEISKITNSKPILTNSRIDFFTKSRTFNTDKSTKLLNFEPIKLEDGLKKTIKWYAENGHI